MHDNSELIRTTAEIAIPLALREMQVRRSNITISVLLGVLSVIFLAGGIYSKDPKVSAIGGSLALSIVTLWRRSGRGLVIDKHRVQAADTSSDDHRPVTPAGQSRL